MKLVGKDGRLLSKSPGRLLRIRNYYVVGGTAASGANRLRKYDADGDLEFDVFNLAIINAVEIDQDEFIYIGHQAIGLGGGGVSIRQLDFSDGSELQFYSFPNSSHTLSLSLDLRRNIYLGSSGSTSQAKLRKITPSGDTLFTVFTSDTTGTRGVSGDRENNVVASVYQSSNNIFQKYNSGGDVLWSNTLVTNTIYCISTDVDLGIYIAGFSFVTQIPGLYKYNASGGQVWTKLDRTQNSVDARRVNSDGDVEVVYCGILANGSNIRKADGDLGGFIWAANLGGGTLRSVSVDLSGDVIVGSSPIGSPEKNIRKVAGSNGDLIWDLITASGQTINSVKAT